jgi:hypothetical protein
MKTLKSFVKIHPYGTVLEGQIVTRIARCLCGALFTQTELDPDGLSGFKDGARAKYLESCAVTPSGAIYQPPSCPRCERRKL